MTNLAAVLPAPGAHLQIQEIGIPKPGPHQLLIRNELIALTPFDFKIARLGRYPLQHPTRLDRIPVQYPTIIGSSFGGTIMSVGTEVTGFRNGDRVVVALQKFTNYSNQFGAFQRFVIAGVDTVSKVPDGVDIKIPASLVANLSTVVSLFNGRAGFDRPDLNKNVSANGKKVLVYGGSSSSGSLFIQYITQAGYGVVTTTSPRSIDFVSRLGAVGLVDHTQDLPNLVAALIREGPYDLVIDTISLPNTVAITAAVAAAQGGGKLYTIAGSTSKPETANSPSVVNHKCAPWPTVFDEERNDRLLDWAFKTYFPQAIEMQKLIPLPVQKIRGGLRGLNSAIDVLEKGVNGVKLVADPWE